MTLKEINKMIDDESSKNYYFEKTSYYNKIMLLKLKKIFSEYFFIPEDTIYSTPVSMLFFISIVANKPLLDIEKVKIDILNNIPDIALCIKYTESLDVIQEIKANLHNDIKILSNKFYISKDLYTLLNLTKNALNTNKVLINASIKHQGKSHLCWEGRELIKNLDTITKKTKNGIKVNKEITPLRLLCDKLDLSMTTFMRRIENGKKIFGIDLSYIHNVTIKNRTNTVFIKTEDYKKILSNKKYYIKVSEIKNDFILSHSNTIKALIKYYNFIYKKQSSLKNIYIKKETVSILKEIHYTYNNNYDIFVDKLINFIKREKNKTFDIKIICSLIPYLSIIEQNKFDNIIKKSNVIIKNNIIDKKNTLILLEYMKSISRRLKYQKKKQGE